MAVARYYRADKNESGAAFPGVPLRDLDQEEWEALPTWIQASVDASDIYQKTKPESETPRRAKRDEEG